MLTVVSLIYLGPSSKKTTHHFLLHGSLGPTNLEKNLKPCKYQNLICLPTELLSILYSNKKEMSDFPGTVSFDLVKMLQQK